MKQLLIATACLAACLIIWVVFLNYNMNFEKDALNTINNEILNNIEEENWGEAFKNTKKLEKDWLEFRSKALFIINNDDINEIDYSIGKAIMFIKVEDASNGGGELDFIKKQISLITDNDFPIIENIF